MKRSWQRPPSRSLDPTATPGANTLRDSGCTPMRMQSASELCTPGIMHRQPIFAMGNTVLQRNGPLKRGPESDGLVRGGSVAPTPIGLIPPSVGLLAASVAIETATVAVISAARTVPALTLSAAEAALVEARTIPAIHVKAERDVLDRSKRFDCQIGTERRAQCL